ncbi:hypothetical protein IscW_ISCW008806 [Ixodes scapularis]|uniref:Uncharacterized protein n=1 Tax=Ixodes scapularis TaxID=6945 RepID=B7Q206_IXOSC|nr:hypothetical protein IscW_ISCW008806 [Ixodes scapularis]|eukprot:XP_002410324.1 hypothetical protein IscW_ISCW008806 [Ixodes scapularis]
MAKSRLTGPKPPLSWVTGPKSANRPQASSKPANRPQAGILPNPAYQPQLATMCSSVFVFS